MVKKVNAEDNNATILETSQELTVAGKVYEFRRLNTQDVFQFAKILSKALSKLGNVEMTQTSEEAIGLVMMVGLADNDIEMAKFYGSMIGLTAEEFFKQPPEFFGEFLDIMPQQYDLKTFFATVLKVVKSLGSLLQTQ